MTECERLLLTVALEWEHDGLIDTMALRHRAEVVEYLAQRGLVEIVDEISDRWLRAREMPRPSGRVESGSEGLRSEEFLGYLVSRGWRLVRKEAAWYILETEIAGQSISVYLPTEKNTHYAAYIAAALHAVAAVHGETPNGVVADIRRGAGGSHAPRTP